MNASVPVLQMSGVSKAFPSAEGPVNVLKSVDLAIMPGEFVMITGPSGSGKSTLLHLAALLDAPSSGRTFFAGRDVTGLPEEAICDIRRKEIGMVFQKFCLLPHRSALENVFFRFRYTEAPEPSPADRVERILSDMGLSRIRNRPARLLSAGEMQRVAIARAVILPPTLLVADEPTGNLDSRSCGVVMEIFRNLHRQGLTVLMATHNENLLEYATRHLVCRDGEVK